MTVKVASKSPSALATWHEYQKEVERDEEVRVFLPVLMIRSFVDHSFDRYDFVRLPDISFQLR